MEVWRFSEVLHRALIALICFEAFASDCRFQLGRKRVERPPRYHAIESKGQHQAALRIGRGGLVVTHIRERGTRAIDKQRLELEKCVHQWYEASREFGVPLEGYRQS